MSDTRDASLTRDHDAVIERVRASRHQKVKVAVADIDGVLRGKLMHREKFLTAIDKGFGFCSVVLGWDCNDQCYDDIAYSGWHNGYPDSPVQLDLATYREIPWEDGLPFVLGDFGASAAGGAIGPRALLRRVVDQATALGVAPLMGCEFEWFNFDETPETLAVKHGVDPTPLTPGMFGYSLLRSGYRREYFDAIFDELGAFGVPIEGLHTETGPGVYEAAIRPADAIEAADRAVLLKTGVKEIAYRHGVTASFMARWSTALPGCSGHIHQSLWDLERSRSLFADPSGEHGMSALFRHYLAGQLALLPELLPMYAPTVNSYKRLVEGYWAPTSVTWGVDNRTVALRVITGGSATRVETRVSGSDINPYLAVAASLASGLHGIREGLPLELAPVVGNGYAAPDAERLPPTLEAAALKMRGSATARALFGDAFVDHYTTTRLWEWREAQKAVTDWELRRYFEII